MRMTHATRSSGPPSRRRSTSGGTGERQAMTMLDTMQEALIQVLDRIEAIEHTTRARERPRWPRLTAFTIPPRSLLATRLANRSAAQCPTPHRRRARPRDADVDERLLERAQWPTFAAASARSRRRHRMNPRPTCGPAVVREWSRGREPDGCRSSTSCASTSSPTLSAPSSRQRRAAPSRSTLKVATRRPQIGSRLSAWVAAQAASGAGKLLGALAEGHRIGAHPCRRRQRRPAHALLA